MITADGSIDSVELSVLLRIWRSVCLNYFLVRAPLLSWNNCFHIGDHELVPLLHPVEITLDHLPKMLAECEVTGTTGSFMLCNFCFPCSVTGMLLWSSMDSKCSSRIQKAFPELPAGRGRQHVSSCQTQLPASEVTPWVGAGCSGWLQHNSRGGPINWVMMVL